MDVREETISGITYIIETNDKGVVVAKHPKYKGPETVPPKDPLAEINEKLDLLALEIKTIKEQTKI